MSETAMNGTAANGFGGEPLRLLIHAPQPLLARLLAESLAARGYQTQVETELPALAAADDQLPAAALLLTGSDEVHTWLAAQPPARRRKCLVLGDGDLDRFADLDCRLVSPADSLERIEQELRHLTPADAEPRQVVLIVDDDPDTRATIREYFQALGYDCRSAANGQEALARIREETPRVILLDLNMPELGGLDFLKMVRRLDNSFGIVVVTALHDPRIAARAVAAGAFDVVEKPINFQHLAYLVRIQISYREMRAR